MNFMFCNWKITFCPYNKPMYVLCLRGTACSVVLHPVGLWCYESPAAFSVQCEANSFILNLYFRQAGSKCNVETGGIKKETHSGRESVTYKSEKKKLC